MSNLFDPQDPEKPKNFSILFPPVLERDKTDEIVRYMKKIIIETENYLNYCGSIIQNSYEIEQYKNSLHYFKKLI